MSPLDQSIGFTGPLSFTAIVVALSVWLGRVWQERISEREKTENAAMLARKNRIGQMAGDVDIDLRKHRIETYPELWKQTDRLPLWPRNEKLTYDELADFSRALRQWYFERGGIYLSRSTFDHAYRPLQETLRNVLEKHLTGSVSQDDYEQVRQKCSDLRHGMTDDIVSRREGPNFSTAET